MKQIVLMIYLFYIVNTHNTYKCQHDKLSKKYPQKLTKRAAVNQTQQDDGKRLEESWRQMDILFDFSNVKGVDTEFQIFVQNTIFTQIKELFQKILLVKGPKKSRTFSDTCQIKEITIPDEYNNKTLDHDLVIFVSVINEDSSFLAYASPCTVDQVTGRPYVGFILINTKFLSIGRKEIYHNYHIFIHELMHVLVFSPQLYDLFITQPAYRKETIQTDKGTTNVYSLITPKLVQEAKNHFKCSSLTGLHLENQGTESSLGSHFESRTLGNELMTAQKAGLSQFSKFSYALLEDSGWYKVDYSYADVFTYGKDNGCEFLSNYSCSSSFRDYCTQQGQTSCSNDYLSKTVCGSTEFTDSCNIYTPAQEIHCLNTYSFYETSINEESGIESRCYNTVYQTQNFSGCYKSKCQDNILKVTVNGQQYECSKKDDVIKIDETFEIICPNPEDFCSQFAQKCTNDCSGNGYCTSGKTCECEYFYKGSTCSEKQDCHNNDTQICSLLQEVSSTTTFKSVLPYSLFIFYISSMILYFSHIYSQANGHAKGDTGSSTVYSSKKKSSAASNGSDYSNSRTKHHSFNQMAEYQYNNNGWGNEIESKKKSQQSSRNNANAEAYGNASTNAVSEQNNTESFAKGDDFSKSEANFNINEKQTQEIKQKKKRGIDHKLIHHKNNIKNKIRTNSIGRSHGKGYSHSKGNRNGSQQNNKGHHKTNSHATYHGNHHNKSTSYLKNFHNQHWGDKSWDSNDKYWDNFY